MGVSVNQGQGGKRSLDAELNLVPFIDLLSMCICFLLMTAVWLEIGAIQIHQLFGSKPAAADEKKTVEVKIRWLSESKLLAEFVRDGQVVQQFEATGATPVEMKASLDTHMNQVIGPLGFAGADGLEMIGKVHSNSRISYGDVISVLDVLKSFGVGSLALLPEEG